MYRPVSRSEISDGLIHLRELYREFVPSNDREILAHEKRKIVTKNLLSNLHRTKEHPTLHAVLEVADVFGLTIDGAHRLFGYSLDDIREYDVKLNGGRTHIIESYSFQRDFLVDLPWYLDDTSFGEVASLPDLVREWQRDVPIRALEEESWRKPGTFYVHVGTEDSLGSSLPPGATAMVESIGTEEQSRPNPRAIYLLQFGNGYRCSRCVVTRGRLLLLVSGRNYVGPQEFTYPGGVRIAGRIRMFAMDLPLPDYPLLRPLPPSSVDAPLILPWEHRSLDQLFAAKYYRFQRTRRDLPQVRRALEKIFHTSLSGRTERRYRHPTASQPHIDTLIQLTMTNVARYTDSLRASQSFRSDNKRYSLEALLGARRLSDLPALSRKAETPVPQENWARLRKEFPEWPTLLSMKFPQMQALGHKVARLPNGSAVKGLDPPLSPGSLILLEKLPPGHNLPKNHEKGWSRSMYAFRKGKELLVGYLERVGDEYALRPDLQEGISPVRVGRDDFTYLNRIAGVAVPV